MLFTSSTLFASTLLFAPSVLGAPYHAATENGIDGEYLVMLKTPQFRAESLEEKDAHLHKLMDSYLDSLATKVQDLPSFRASGDLLDHYQLKETWYTEGVMGFHAHFNTFALSLVLQDEEVDFVEQDSMVNVTQVARCLRQNTNDWGLVRTTQVRSVRSTNYDYPSQTWTNIEVYVLDTGIRRSHTEFQNRAVWGTDSISRSPHRTDRQGHGTHVAGTIGGRLFGVAKGVRMIDVRVLGDDGGGTMSSIIGGINWVANRQRGLRRTGIANLSLGGPFSLANNRAVDAATAAGVLMVTASGNENQNGCNVSPGSASTALNVNAADINDNPARFSNWGTCTHIYAPGVDIRSAGHRGDTAVATMSGTSMAAPHMAGVAAKILAENPRQSVQQLRAAVFQRATRNAMRRVDRNTPNVYLRHTC